MGRYSVHLAVNVPDQDHYGTDVGRLEFAHADALAWHQFATAQGFDAWPPLLGPQATTTALEDWVRSRAAFPGAHQFLVTWSGHGTQVTSRSGAFDVDDDDRSGADGLDESWVMWDRMLFDDEVFGLMCQFRKEAGVIVVADSCHSHTSLLLENNQFGWALFQNPWRARYVADGTAESIVQKHPEIYNVVGNRSAETVAADVIGLAACEDEQKAYEGEGYGRFTRALLDLLGGGFSGSYEELIETAGHLTPGQDPRTFWFGSNSRQRDQPAFGPWPDSHAD